MDVNHSLTTHGHSLMLMLTHSLTHSLTHLLTRMMRYAMALRRAFEFVTSAATSDKVRVGE